MSDSAPLSRWNGSPPSRRAGAFLALGMGLGCALAAGGLLAPRAERSGDLPPGAVARVNGEVIRSEDYRRLIQALAGDRRDQMRDADYRHVIDRLIDEELLVQRALELGLARHDRRVRADLTNAVISSVIAQEDDRQPTDRELREFYETNLDYFARPGRLRVRQIFFRVSIPADAAAAERRAREAARRWRAGESFAALRESFGDDPLSPLPDALLPPAKLLDYLGPTALRTALELPAGEVSDPVRSGAGFHLLQVIERRDAEAPPLAEIRPQVTAEFRRRAGERALRTYLDGLRKRADVAVAPVVP
jgi:parvulin-like peptidyl-prolyl isomerase